MRFLIFLTAAFIISILTSCNTTTKEVQVEKTIAATFPERAKDMVIYEVNTRQFTPEGTFQAFIPHMERIRNMGVDILWIMPIQPIGVSVDNGTPTYSFDQNLISSYVYDASLLSRWQVQFGLRYIF